MLFPIRPLVCTVAVVLAPLAFGCDKGPKKTEATSEPAAAAHGGDAVPTVKLSPAQGELTTLLPAEAAKARAKNLKPFVEVRADWCGPCKAIESTMHDPLMADAFAGTYLVKLDADDWKAEQFKAANIDARAIPIFFELDDAGKVTSRRIDGSAWGDNIPANMAPPLKKFFRGSRS